MKILFVFTLLAAAIHPPKTHRQLFNNFHTVYAKADFKAMDALLTSDFTGTNERDSISFQKPDYLDYMKGWNQVFKTKWHVVSVKEVGETIESIEYDTDMYNDYFYGGQKRTIKYIYYFEKEQIKKIQTFTTPEGVKAEAIFQERFRKFYIWVSEKHQDKLSYCTQSDKAAATEIKKLLEVYIAGINAKK